MASAIWLSELPDQRAIFSCAFISSVRSTALTVSVEPPSGSTAQAASVDRPSKR